MQRFLIGVGVAMGLFLGGCESTPLNPDPQKSPERSLTVWWSEGDYPEEAQIIQSTIEEWQTLSKVPVDLVFYPEEDLVKQAENALAAQSPPDMIYGHNLEQLLLPRLAWDGQLADVSSVLEPLKNQYPPQVLESVRYYNALTQERSVYALPIAQQTVHIHYWLDLLNQSEKIPQNIPSDWRSFWQFWGNEQQALSNRGRGEIYGLGMPLSISSMDTFMLFEQFLEAYNVQLLNPDGTLNIDTPQNRQGIIAALTDYTRPYKAGQIPPGATEWSDPDNNITFLSGITLMAANVTFTIPASQRDDRSNYYDRIRTVPWPNKPDGTPMRYITSTKQLAIIGNSPHLEDAKNLASFLIQPQTLQAYGDATQGSVFPVVPAILKNAPIWNNPQDPHIPVIVQQYQNTRLPYTVLNPAYSNVQAHNVWAKALSSIAIDNMPVEQAADQAIETVKTLFADWSESGTAFPKAPNGAERSPG